MAEKDKNRAYAPIVKSILEKMEKAGNAVDGVDVFYQETKSVHKIIFLDRAQKTETKITIKKRQYEFFFKYLLPSKRREEVLGDLIETRFEMKMAGCSQWKINLVMFWHKWWALVAMWRVKLGDYGKRQQKTYRGGQH